MGSSNGIAGRGGAVTGYIEIHADNTMARHANDGALVETTRFRVEREKTILSDDAEWVLSFDASESEVIRLREGGRLMTPAENAYDGLQREYARNRWGAASGP